MLGKCSRATAPAPPLSFSFPFPPLILGNETRAFTLSYNPALYFFNSIFLSAYAGLKLATIIPQPPIELGLMCVPLIWLLHIWASYRSEGEASVVVQACDPSILGDWDRRITSLSSSWATWEDRRFKKKQKKITWYLVGKHFIIEILSSTKLLGLQYICSTTSSKTSIFYKRLPLVSRIVFKKIFLRPSQCAVHTDLELTT